MVTETLVILPELWRTDPSRGPDDAWWAQNALGLQRVWPECAEVVDRVAREVGVDPRLLVTRMELEQGAVSREWRGEVTNQYAVLGKPNHACVAALIESGVPLLGLASCDAWSLYFLCGVDKTDAGPRAGGWFGPERQLLGCALRFRYWYRGDDGARTVYDPIGEGLVNIYAERVPEWRNWLGLREDARYAPRVPVTRSGDTIVPANQASADCLRYTTSLTGSRRLAEIGRRWFADDYEAEDRSASDRQVSERLQDATEAAQEADPSSTRQVEEEPTVSERRLRIVLDPGHGTRMRNTGSRDTGTATSWGRPTIPEPVANLAIAQRMQTLLEDEGHEVFLTHQRSDYSETLGLADRGQFAVDHKADVFVSIHHDGGSSRGTHGFYHNAQCPNGKRLATALAEAMHEEFGLPYSYGGPSSDWFGKSLGVLAGGGNWRLTEAAALVECCFMAGAGAERDVEIIRSAGYYDRAARALCRAIYLYADLATPDGWAPGDMSQAGDSGVLWPPAISGQPTVTRGDSGVAVRELQEALNRHGATLLVDGAFGPLTHSAVVQFQREHDLDPDGVVGPLTASALWIGR